MGYGADDAVDALDMAENNIGMAWIFLLAKTQSGGKTMTIEGREAMSRNLVEFDVNTTGVGSEELQ